jgi:hypothetical protein
MYQSKTDPSRKFGSAFRGSRFDAYHAGEQPGGSNENEKSEPQERGSSDADVAKAKSPATSFHFVHDHAGNKHTVTSTHEDGTTNQTEHGSAKEAYDSAAQLALEAGGEEQATDVKKRTHPDQQGAESEERGYEMPDLTMA